MVSTQVLKKAKLFNGLSDNELEKVASLSREEKYKAGEIIFEEGDSARDLYIVEEGEIALETRLDLGPYVAPRPTVIEVVTPGEAFGWSALMEPHILTSSARCLKAVRVVAIEGGNLRHLLDSDARIGQKVMDRLASIIASRLRDTREKLKDFLIGGELALEYTPEETALLQRLRYSITFRWLAIVGVIVVTLFARYVFHIGFPIRPVYIIAACIAAYNLLFQLWVRRLATKSNSSDLLLRARRFATMESVVDLLALSALLHFTGGIENPFLFYFIFHIIGATMLLSYRTVYWLATLAVFLFGSLVGLEYFAIIPHVHLEGFVSADLYRQEAYISTVFLTFVTTLYISAYMMTAIAGELRKRQREVISLKDRLLAESKALKEANQKLIELDRLRTYFMGMVSHDLKSPIVAVESYLQVILGGFVGEVNEEQREMLARSSYRIGELLNLISDLLDVSRIEAGQIEREFEALSLCEVIKKSVEDVRALAEEKEMELRVEIPEELPSIYAAPNRLQQALNNLLGNAVKFTPEKGLVTLRVESMDEHCQVEVIDTGPGIHADDLPHIFEDFFRGRDARTTKGTGLGLSIAKRIVEAHQGKIWAESPCVEGKGSRFVFILPIKPV
ncbi:MAG: ATP-binding protein [Anaerolineae bacterium]|nr:ATP-binding protein [Anaerolineae bacterium]